MPALVIVCGPPASGKTELATHLGSALHVPVISKDLVKESMMDHLGGGSPVGAAAFAVLFAIARQLLVAGTDLILEGAFFRDQSAIQQVAALADAIVVEVGCRPDVLEQRFTERHSSRHLAHRGPEALPELRERMAKAAYGVPDLHRPTLRVDTTNGFEPPQEQILRWVREQITTST